MILLTILGLTNGYVCSAAYYYSFLEETEEEKYKSSTLVNIFTSLGMFTGAFIGSTIISQLF